ncbi:MAG: thioredoxin-disulfide reductase [Bacilli bacterium]|nr:thioredoxin-disulfide reductase [Bacilli bacterium]
MYDIIIVGAGPAGLTASIYARRADKKVLVLEANSYGGQIISASDVENYPGERHISGFDFATKLYNQAKDLGSEIVFEKVIDIKDDKEKEVVTTNNTYKAKAVILATGSFNRKLGIDKEEEFIGKGVSYCATCDGAFFKNKDVAVVGGGNTALEDALYLSDIVKKVYIIHRRDSFRGDEKTLKELKSKDNVIFVYNSNVTRLIGNEKLEGIEVKDNDGKVAIIDVDGIFIAIGRIPENRNFSKLIKLDELGYAISGEDCHTNVDGVFVAGDNRTKSLRQLVTATSDGGISATEAIKYINSIKNN